MLGLSGRIFEGYDSRQEILCLSRFTPRLVLLLSVIFAGFVVPEMVKRRPAIVVSPRLRGRSGLCTIVPLSTTPPAREQKYHCLLELNPPLPRPFDAEVCWVKGDMLYTVSFARLNLPHEKDAHGKRLI